MTRNEETAGSGDMATKSCCIVDEESMDKTLVRDR
jgi:hypothetical protein